MMDLSWLKHYYERLTTVFKKKKSKKLKLQDCVYKNLKGEVNYDFQVVFWQETSNQWA